ncbi:thioredoxin domain-containing protein [Oleiharenicola lentus]|uniref:thioredoxin domain-containing protein n=1 Tax=Oleiharenicola lentus TaxID=2508720 RepID=UPI003F67E4A3
MKRFIGFILVSLVSCAALRAQEPAVASTVSPAAAMEKQVADVVAGPQVTIVHFWAPWCPNCRAEMTPEGWAKFIGANPDVKFVFLNVWHRGQDPQPKLDAGNLSAQPNLTLLTHPSAVSKAGDDRLNTFLGLPVTWLPTTWVFREGKLRYGLNYGEVRFEMLQQLVNDSTDKWKH